MGIELINISDLSDEKLFETIKLAINISKYCNKIVNERIDGFTHTNIKNDVLYIYRKLIDDVLINRISNNQRQIRDIEIYRRILKQLNDPNFESDDISKLRANKDEIKNRYNPYSYFNKYASNTKNIQDENSRLENIKKDVASHSGKFRGNNYL